MIRVDRAHLQVAALSHPGMTGKNNEDRYAVSAYQLSAANPTPSVFAVLSDGIGGHKAGEVAAELAVEVLSRRVAESDGSDPTGTLEAAIVEASQQIFEYAQSDGALQGMGATCACAWVIGSRLYSTSIGDSRIYLIRNQAIHQLTTDHTWIQEALDKGVLKPEEVRGHPNAHVIRRFLGSPTPPEVDLRLRLSSEEDDAQAMGNQGLPLLTGDQLLLCSDGLTDLVKDSEILAVMTAGTLSAEGAVQELVNLANERGGHDNITIVTLELPREEALPEVTVPMKTAAAPRKRSSTVPWLVAGCGGLVLLVAIAGVLLYTFGFFDFNFGGQSPSATPAATVELPPALLTVLPNGSTTPLPTAQAGTPSILETPQAPGTLFPGDTPTSGRPAATYTPWPTNTPHP